MATASDVIRVAEGEIGSTNGAKYFNHFGAPDYGPWCVAFVRYCMDVAGAPFPWSTWYAWDWTDAPSRSVVAPEDLQPGDAVAFDWDGDVLGDHVGIVKSVHDWGIVTIEGNTSYGVCKECQRVWSCVICGIRPDYKSDPVWIKSADGRWWYCHADGSYTTSDWELIDDEWYYFDAEGWMYVGWLPWGGAWYYLSEWHDGLYGHMVHDGIYADKSTGRCFAFDSLGKMVESGEIVAVPHQAHDGSFGALELA